MIVVTIEYKKEISELKYYKIYFEFIYTHPGWSDSNYDLFDEGDFWYINYKYEPYGECPLKGTFPLKQELNITYKDSNYDGANEDELIELEFIVKFEGNKVIGKEFNPDKEDKEDLLNFKATVFSDIKNQEISLKFEEPECLKDKTVKMSFLGFIHEFTLE